jgi:membrane-associated phospholipid phosphatase
MQRNIEYRISQIISNLGHPIVLGIVAAIYVNFREFEFQKALNLTLLLLFCCVVPLLGYLTYKIKKGEFKDFDVSDKDKRQKLYVFLLLLLALFSGYIFWSQDSKLIKSGVVPVYLLILFSYLINFRFKISLHTSFSFMLAVMMIEVDNSAAFTLLLFALLIGYSRLYLKRHKMPEVALGALLGVLLGLMFHFIFV